MKITVKEGFISLLLEPWSALFFVKYHKNHVNY